VRRRDFITLVCGVGIEWPLSTVAQQPVRVRRIGWLVTGSFESSQTQTLLRALLEGLREHGYVEGRDVVFEYRAAELDFARFPSLAAELVHQKPDIILAGNTESARAVLRATATIPIVCPSMADPVGDGLVASLARPGGNITGLTFIGPELIPKVLDVLKETLPSATRVVGLWHPGIYGERTMRKMLEGMEAGARNRQIQLQLLEARTPDELARALFAMNKEKADALIMLPSPVFFDQRQLIVDLAAKHQLPSFFLLRDWVEIGGLISYGPNLNDLWHRAANYIDRVFKGAKPADLPVEQPTKFELVVNLKTAKALGITIPPTLLARADEMIE
jgi:putative tryptophan/tyrosine transport system substrate-binding protein